MTETLILVDERNTTLGYAPRHECHAGDGHLHRAIVVVLVDRAHRVLLQHRKSALWDGYWDVTGATHTLHRQAGEESCVDAAQRCLVAEWGLERLDSALNVQFGFTYFERHGAFCENEYCFVVTGEYTGPVRVNPRHAYGFRWMNLEQCKDELLIPSSNFTPWARITLSRLSLPSA